jgi:hypothetical protein
MVWMVISASLLVPVALILVMNVLMTEGSMPSDDQIASLSDRLIDDAMTVLKSYPAGTLLENREAWPETIRALSPLSLWVGHEGVYIKSKQRFVESWGLFIPREDSEKYLEQTTIPSYSRITKGVYKYYAD